MRRLFVLLCALFLLASSPAHAAEPAQKLILAPSGDTIFTIEARYPPRPGVCEFKRPKPLRARYRGRLDIVRADDGTLRIINRLPFETYLRGLAEVPPSWPVHALRAQVIAARSYALDALHRPTADLKRKGADICSTDACQVYRGALVELGAFGERWVAAVRATKARALTYGGRIVQAFYFSTSDGRTRRSFPGGTPQPYYPSVSGEDADAPLAHWVARISLGDLRAVLRSRDEWSGGAITGITQSGDTVRLSDGATTRTFERSDLRRALNQDAPCLFPERYPPEDDGAKLPQTIPSSTYAVARDGARAIFRGRGWGHGVGMSQWGARSLAERGKTDTQILSHFYGPARVRRVEVPEVIRVLAAEGLRSVRISADGPFTARTETGSTLAPSTRFEVRGGTTIRILRGRGPSLKSVLSITPSTTRIEADPDEDITVPFTLSGRARVRAQLLRGDTPVRATKERSFESKAQTLVIPAAEPLEPGDYRLVLRAYDGLDHVRSVPIPVDIAAPAPSVPPVPAPAPASHATWPFVLIAAGLLGASVFALRKVRQPKVKV